MIDLHWIPNVVVLTFGITLTYAVHRSWHTAGTGAEVVAKGIVFAWGLFLALVAGLSLVGY